MANMGSSNRSESILKKKGFIITLHCLVSKNVTVNTMKYKLKLLCMVIATQSIAQCAIKNIDVHAKITFNCLTIVI